MQNLLDLKTTLNYLIKKVLSEGAIIIAHKAVKITKEITPGLMRTYK